MRFLIILFCLCTLSAFSASNAQAQNHVKVSKDKIPEDKEELQRPEQNPDLYFFSDSGLNVGQTLLKREKYTEAISVFENVLKRNPRNIDALAGIGAGYLGLGQTKQAGDILRKAISRDNKHTGANYLLGLYYLETGKISNAVDQAQVLYMLCGRYSCPEETSLSAAINRAKKE